MGHKKRRRIVGLMGHNRRIRRRIVVLLGHNCLRKQITTVTNILDYMSS
jgi:hypothetical protein